MLLVALFSLAFFSEAAQKTSPTDAQVRMDAWTTRHAMEQDSLLKNLEARNVGPRNMGGRIVAVQGFEDIPHTFYAAYASGGLWVTTNNGVTWDPLFDSIPSITIGDFRVNPKNLDEIWVGTGEVNSSRSSYAGTGMYHTTDGGKTWENKGLIDSHHIGRIILHPNDPKTLWVGVLGHLYSTNKERGIFKTTDGGKTWKNVLFINDNTGVVDMVMDPKNPDRLYAAAWERSRKAWDFQEAGTGSGVYLSKDGGETWKAINKGLPAGEHMGRIGISVCLTDPDVLYVSVDNQGAKEPEPETSDNPLTRRKLAEMDKDAFLALEDKDIDKFLRSNRFHKEVNAAGLRKQIEAGDASVDDVRQYLYDSNEALYGETVIGVEVYRSNNGGKSWKRTHEEPIPDLAYSYGYYFGVIAVDPNDKETIYVGGVPLIKSTDGGKNFEAAQTPNVHVDHQAIWINPTNSKHILLGNDGGLNMTWDAGKNWAGYQFQSVGQFYTVAYDMAQPYRVYGGLQDNGVWRGPSREHGRYDQPWEPLNGGDGAFVQVDFRDNETVYSGLQFGNYSRLNAKTRERLSIYPRHRLKEDPTRYNWMTPFVLSRHHQDVAYMASQRVMRSMDKGETWEPISPDLTHNATNIGDVPFCTVTALRESPHAFGTLYAGTDDGRLWVTRGAEWTEIGQDITKGLWISSIEISPHTAGTVFVTMTGYRNDDFTTHVHMSTDYGATWTNLKNNLPEEPCNVIRQDTAKEHILYLGTDVGLWLSMDKGKSWLPHQAGMPNVPVYAMEVHHRDNDLIVATHGRSIYVLELEILQQMEAETLNKDFHMFSVGSARFGNHWGMKGYAWYDFGGPNDIKFPFFTAAKSKGTLSIYHEETLLHKADIAEDRGVREAAWLFRISEKKAREELADKLHKGEDGFHYAKSGSYKAVIEIGDHSEEVSFTIK